MLPPDFFDDAIYDYLELMGKVDASITADIVRRICKTGFVTDTAKWQIEKLQQSGLLFDDVVSELAKYSDASEQQLRALFEDAGITSLDYDNEIYKGAGLDPPLLRQSPALLKTLEAGLKKTGGIVKNLTSTTAVAAQNAYHDACDLAYQQLISGAFDYNTIIRRAVQQAAAQGTTVLYPSGHIDKLDVAIRRALLTGVNQTSGILQLDLAAEMECDLVETTAHAGARPEHVNWQGQVFSRSGRNKKYRPFSDTGYGSGEGLCGFNCRHNFFPFFEGFSLPAYSKAQLKELNNAMVDYDGESIPLYEATQRQRSMERTIRATRRELTAYDTATKNGVDMKDSFSGTSVKLKKQEAAYRDFCGQTGLFRDTARMQAAGFGRSVSQKAVHSNKTQVTLNNINHELQTMRESGIIRVTGTFCSVPKLPTNLVFEGHALEQMLKRGISIEDMREMLHKPRFAIRQRNGAQHVLYSDKGFIAVGTNGKIATIGYMDDGGKKILEAAKKYGY